MNIQRIFIYSAIFLGVFAVAPAFAQAATLSLSPASGTHAAGATFEVKIQLDTTGTATSGTDAYLTFDPTVLQVVDANTSATGVQILPGTLYTQTSYNDVQNGEGKISFSGSKSGGSPGYTGSGTLATITFQATKEASSTPVNFNFTSGSTTDSNVISSADSSDVLTAVTNAAYTITGASGTDGSTTGTDGSGSGTGADGTGGTDGSGGSGTVAGTGIDLTGYIALTLFSLIGAGYFLTRKPKHR